MAERAIEPHRRRATRALFAFLVVSVAVHAVVLIALAPPAQSPPAKPGVLEVVILQPEPLPVAPPESTPQVPPPRKPERQRTAQDAPPKPQPERKAPVLELSEPRLVAESPFTAPRSKASEAPAAASGEQARVVSAAVAPPSINAAYLSSPAPRYPVAARRAGEQGTVTLRVLVTRDGLPSRVDVEKSSGSPHLDAAALEAVKAWRFVPARQGADPIESWMLVPVVFRLEGTS